MLASALAVVLIGVAGCSSDSKGDPTPAAQNKAPDKVTYLTAFGAVGRDAFAWVAQEKGYFKEAGLDVDIQLGAATGENLKGLASGKAQFANLDLIGAWILAGKGEYKDFRAIAAIHQQTLVSIVALEGGGITAPKDLEGKKLGAATGSVNQLLFPGYAKLAGIDPTKIQWVNAQPAQLPALLAGGQVQALSTFLIGSKGIEKAAGGKKSVVLPYSKYLGDLYGNGIITTSKIAKENPDLAKRFRDASLKALKYTIEHPDDAAQILKKAQPAADVTAAIGEITLMTPYVTSGSAIGVMDQERVARAIATLQASELIPAGLTPDSVVDFSLTPKA
ncbi:ABC transporter substrate-binding protein [Dactylosporangium vinaceum]|uniref:Thiamine pyrimidine synthase n=1 Tax=Dactylosporangium vinaceum TaxID=53362 RepID=A0ABV5MP42_9ACTN|nr:ABC transporter substrate-binding protein [Dactylosporangium vinaceum]UAB94500.1 ABC transporter substrate-binding protein [Dactylosporangium vinaceum]